MFWYSVTPEPDDYAVSGIDIDGARYQLEGQPDMAVSHGWGNLIWMFG